MNANVCNLKIYLGVQWILGGTAECNKTISQRNLTVLLMYETASLKKVGKSYWQLFNFGSEWVSK